MECRARRLPLLAVVFFTNILAAQCSHCPDGLCAKPVSALQEAAKPAEKPAPPAQEAEVPAAPPAANLLRAHASRTRLKTEPDAAQSEKLALSLEAEPSASPSAGKSKPLASGVEKLLNTNMLQIDMESEMETVAASAHWPTHVFAQGAMRSGVYKPSWFGSMGMIFSIAGMIIFMVLVLFAFQEKASKKEEIEPPAAPPLQFLRNSQMGEAYPQHHGRGPSALTVPRGPASTSSGVSHLRDPRFASGAKPDLRGVREGSGAPWAA